MTDIPGERARLAAQGLVIERRETWGAAADYRSDRPVQRPADCLFLHVAVALDPAIDTQASERQVMRNIERIGIERFPSTGFSYNAACFDSGRLYEGQPVTRRGAHTLNDEQVSICPVHGGSLTAPSWNLNVNVRAMVLPQMVTDDVTDAQVDSIARWGAALIRAGEVKRGARWHGHRDVSSKDCPGGTGFARIPRIQALTEHYVAHGLTSAAGTGDDVALTDEDKAWLEKAIGVRVPQPGELAAIAADVKAARAAAASGELIGAQLKTAVAALGAQVAGLDLQVDTEDVEAIAEQLAPLLGPFMPSVALRMPVDEQEALAQVLLDAQAARLQA